MAIKEKYNKHRNLILYGIIGVSGAGLDWFVFTILFNVFGINYLVAKCISTTLGITNNFLWNASMNFKVKDVMHKRFLTFYGIGVIGLGISLIILKVLVDFLHWNANLSNLITIFVIVCLQYILNKKFSFKKYE